MSLVYHKQTSTLFLSKAWTLFLKSSWAPELKEKLESFLETAVKPQETPTLYKIYVSFIVAYLAEYRSDVKS